MFYLPFSRFSLFWILSSSNVSFVSARTMATFRRSFYWWFNFHDFFENFFIHECDLLLRLKSWWDFHTLPFIFSTFEGWHGAFPGDSEIVLVLLGRRHRTRWHRRRRRRRPGRGRRRGWRELGFVGGGDDDYCGEGGRRRRQGRRSRSASPFVDRGDVREDLVVVVVVVVVVNFIGRDPVFWDCFALVFVVVVVDVDGYDDDGRGGRGQSRCPQGKHCATPQKSKNKG